MMQSARSSFFILLGHENKISHRSRPRNFDVQAARR